MTDLQRVKAAEGEAEDGLTTPGWHSIEGHVDGIADGLLSGWAFDRDRPAARLTLSVLLDGETVGSVLADQYRPDLAQAGKADGQCAFVFDANRVPALLRRRDPVRLAVRLAEPDQVLIGSVEYSPTPVDEIADAAMTPEGAPAGRFEGRLDGLLGGVVHGWVWQPEAAGAVVDVEVVAGRAPIGRYAADLFRADLLELGIGDGRHALAIDLRPLVAIGLAADTEIELRAGQEGWRLGRIPYAALSAGTAPSVSPAGEAADTKLVPGGHAHWLRSLFAESLCEAALALADAGCDAPRASPRPMLHDRMMRPATADDSGVPLSRFAEFVRHGERLDRHFRTDLGREERAAFLKWYLEAYGTRPGHRRAPLSREEIAYLNEPMPVPGKRFDLTRATFAFLLDDPARLARLDLNAVGSFAEIVYWWAIERAPALFVEDCLVPAAYRTLLAEIGEPWSGVPYPLNRFMEMFLATAPRWNALNPALLADRRVLYFALLLEALRQPHLVTHIPSAWLRALLEETAGGASLLSRMGRETFGFHSPVLEPTALARHIARRGFDLPAGRPLTLSGRGDRIRPALLPPPPVDAPCVDVQIIGPFEKVSGLGQACRL